MDCRQASRLKRTRNGLLFHQMLPMNSNFAEQARGICNKHNYARLDLRCLASSVSRGRPGYQVRAGTICWLTMSKTPPQDIPG